MRSVSHFLAKATAALVSITGIVRLAQRFPDAQPCIRVGKIKLCSNPYPSTG